MQDADEILIGIATRQHGVVARWQLEAAGIPVHVIERRIRAGRLRQAQRGVYRLEPIKGARAAEVAAALTCGAGAVVSHRSAAAVFELGRRAGGPVEVSVPLGNPRPRPRVIMHRVRLLAEETTRWDGVPVTTPARTVLDLAGTARPRALEQMVALALRRELTTEAELIRLAQWYRGRPGARELRVLLGHERQPAFTRSDAEALCLAEVRESGLPDPIVNGIVRGLEVDFHWPLAKLVLEFDGFAYHSSRRARARDRQRDAALLAAGYRVMRITWEDLKHKPKATIARLAQALVR
jgi:very-short-patch-repair endonuclease